MPAHPPPAGVGPPTGRDVRWQAAAAELGPAKSLTRLEDRAKQVVTSVSLVATLLTGLGLAAGSLVLRSAPARPLASATVAVALAALVLAISALLLRLTPALAPGNLAEVETWYRRQFRRAYLVLAAGGLLLVAVLLAGATALLVLVTGPADQPTVTLQATGSPPATVTVQVAFPGLPAGQLLHTDVVATAAGHPPVLLARAVSRAGGSDPTTATVTVPAPAGYSTVTATAATTTTPPPPLHCPPTPPQWSTYRHHTGHGHPAGHRRLHLNPHPQPATGTATTCGCTGKRMKENHVWTRGPVRWASMVATLSSSFH